MNTHTARGPNAARGSANAGAGTHSAAVTAMQAAAPTYAHACAIRVASHAEGRHAQQSTHHKDKALELEGRTVRQMDG